MAEMLMGAVISVLTGFGLWAVLPRGVVLTRTHTGEPDTWRIQNSSALPVRISSVAFQGLHEYMTGQEHWLDLPSRPDPERGVRMWLDDELSEIQRQDPGIPWSKVVIQPGDTLTARVPLLTDLRIRYRRAGWTGVAERREVWIRNGP